MKTTTKATDLERNVTASTARRQAETAKTRAAAAVAHEIDGTAQAGSSADIIAAAVIAAHSARAAESAFSRLPKDRRDAARYTRDRAETLARCAAQAMGRDYSGTTTHRVRWSTTANAWSATEKGAQYSSRCKYRKTDGIHTVQLSYAGAPELAAQSLIVDTSRRDRCPLIALHPADAAGVRAATWVVTTRGGQIAAQHGWIATREGDAQIFHSTKSASHAAAGLRKKLEAQQRERELRAAAADPRTDRRARLVARLCAGASATIRDARALGYCTPGIEAFQQRHNIGSRASLPDLVRTGDPSAVALALAVARRIRRIRRNKALTA